MNKQMIATFLMTLTIGIVVVLAWLRVGQYLKIMAVDGCMKASSYTFEDTEKGTKTVEPMKEPYERCMKEKGF